MMLACSCVALGMVLACSFVALDMLLSGSWHGFCMVLSDSDSLHGSGMLLRSIGMPRDPYEIPPEIHWNALGSL